METVTVVLLNLPPEQISAWKEHGQKIGMTSFRVVDNLEQCKDLEEYLLIKKTCTNFYNLKLFLSCCQKLSSSGQIVELVENRGQRLSLLKNDFTLLQGPTSLEEFYRDGYQMVGIEYFKKGWDKHCYFPMAPQKGEVGEERPALFLDRDGVINLDTGYISRFEDIEFCPGVVELIALAQKKGWWVIVVSNQSGIARGYFDKEAVCRLHSTMDQHLKKKGAEVSAWFFCAWHREGRGENRRFSHWRKPHPGMILEAEKSFPIHRQSSLMVGDNLSDQINLPGLTTVLLKGEYDLKRAKAPVVLSLEEVGKRIV